MDTKLSQLASQLSFQGDLQQDVVQFLTHHGFPKTVGHSARVAAEAKRIAALYELDPEQAAKAAWLHDISTVIPNNERIAFAEELGIEVLEEERKLPMIIHQKLSVAIAQELFKISDEGVLSAIGCHTTLKAGASPLDAAVFVADKIAWDQEGDPPYLSEILAALQRSLDQASFCYLDYLWQRQAELVVLHPWAAEAHIEIAQRLATKALHS
jgi:predicted HD superfamily hydrolase involved in NAD metabolism